jgi:hypothetical protein
LVQIKAIYRALAVEQQARVAVPQPPQVWAATANLAFPVPTTIQSAAHRSQRCFVTQSPEERRRTLLPEALGLVSPRATWVFWHFGHAIEAAVVETPLVLATRSSHCARTLGEAAMPSFVPDLYWPLAGATAVKVTNKVAKTKLEL